MRNITMIATVLLLSAAVSGQVRMPAIFGDHMVLQSGVEVPVWGWADPGEKVTVKLGTSTVDMKADTSGNWLVRLPAMKGGQVASLSIQGKTNKIEFNDVVAGEVWIASGQSNMALGLKGALGGKEIAAEANYPSIRLFTVGTAIAGQPKTDCRGSWRRCSPDAVGSFSAVAFFFARKLQQDLGVPVGIINASLNGTTCEAWTPKEILQGDKELKYLVDEWDAKVKAYDPELENERYSVAMAVYRMKLKAWEQADANSKAQGISSPKKPQMPAMLASPVMANNYPGNCYNGMIAPLVRFAVKGVIWYQGESNAGDAKNYRKLLSTMITDWRGQWQNENLAFIFVQLPWRGKMGQSGEEDWALMREAQAKVLEVPMTAMVVTVDNTEGILHPKDKQPVGERLALAAGALVYGSKAPARGPSLCGYTTSGDRMTLQFINTEGGLAAKGGKLTGFAVAGNDKAFVPAQAKIVDDKVEVRADGVAFPIDVRYGWLSGQAPALCNGAGLPARPFRTDGSKREIK